MKKKYLYNGQLIDETDVMDAAKQSGLDINAYAEKAGMKAVDDIYSYQGKDVSAEDILDAANESKLGFDDYVQKAGFQKKSLGGNVFQNGGTIFSEPSKSDFQFNLPPARDVALGQMSRPDETIAKNIEQTLAATDTDIHGEERKRARLELAEKKKKAAPVAIINAARRSLKIKGLDPNNVALIEKEKSKFAKQLENGDAVVSFDKEGKAGLLDNKGIFESFHNHMMNAINANKEAREFKDMTTPQRVEFANKKMQEAPSPYIGTKESNAASFTGLLGDVTPTLGLYAAGTAAGGVLEAAAPATGGLSNLALKPITTFAFNAGGGANSSAMNNVLERYNLIRQKNPNISDELAMSQAEKGEDIDRLAGIAETALFSAVGGKANVGKTTTGKLLKGIAKSGIDLGVKTAGVEFGRSLAQGEGGQDAYDKAIKKFEENAPVGSLLHATAAVLTGAMKAPAIIKNSLKYDISTKMPQEEVQSLLQKNIEEGNITQEQADKVSGDINEFRMALSKVPDGLPEDAQASVAGLILKRDNIKKEAGLKDESSVDIYNQEIESINNQIKEIYRTGKPLEHEINEATGELYKQPEGIVNPKPEIIETVEPDLLGRAKEIANSDVVKGFSAETLKDAANNNPEDFAGYLKEISEQANDPNSNKATVDTYGKELVDIAQKLNPVEEKQSSSKPVDVPLDKDETKRLNELAKKKFLKQEMTDAEIDEYNNLKTRQIENKKSQEKQDLFQPVWSGFGKQEFNVSEKEANGIGFKDDKYFVYISDNNELVVQQYDPQSGHYQPVYNKKFNSQEEAINHFNSTEYRKDIDSRIDEKHDASLSENIIEKSKPQNPEPEKQIKQDVPLVDKETEIQKNENQTPPPIEPPKEEVSVHAEQPNSIFKKSEFARARNRVGIDEFVDQNKTTHLEKTTEAQRTIDKWKEDGVYDDKIADIQERAKVGRINTDEQFIFAKHLADLDATINSIKDVNSPEYDAALSQYTAALEAADAARSEFGRQLGMLAVNKGEPITLADWMAERKQSLDVDNLSDKQKEETKKMFDEYESKLKVADEKQIQADEEISKLKAEIELKNQLQQRKVIRKKNREQLSKEREDIIAAIRATLGKSKDNLSASFVPYADKLIAVAPDVVRLVRNLVEAGASKLSDIVDTVHEILSESIPDVTKKDANDIIAGVYSERKPTLSEYQKQLKKLRTEAKKESAEFKMQDKKKRTLAEIQKIEKKIKNKDFAPEKKLSIGENEMLRKANPRLWKETMDAIISKNDALDKLALAKHRDELARRPMWRKVVGAGGKVLTTAKAIKAGIDDSVTGVQLLLAIYANPKAGFKAKWEALKDINNTRFKRQLAALHNDPFWNTIKESGLDITEPKSLSKENLEELYSGNLLDTKIGGKVNLWTYTGGIFERLFTSMGNNLRLNLFRSRVNELLSQNMTFESHPQEYKDAARVVNELTARGKVAKEIQGASSVVSPIIWAPKMISSSLNILGISDIAMGVKGRGYYQNLTPEARAFAVRQLINGVGTGVAIMAAFAARGWTIDKDPRSNGFGSITSPDGNRRYNVFGRFSSTAKTVTQLATGVKENNGIKTDLDAREGRGVTLWKYVRGKMTPIAGEASDYILNRKRNTFTGKPISPSSLPSDLIAPISVTDMQAGWKNDGYDAILNRMIPAIEGIQVQDKRDFIDKDLPSLLERNKRSKDQDTSNFVNYNKGGKPITEDERNQYIKKRDSIIDAELTKLFNGKSPQNIIAENGEAVTKAYKDLTREQIIEATTAIKRSATEQAQKELFGEEIKTHEQLRAEEMRNDLREKMKQER